MGFLSATIGAIAAPASNLIGTIYGANKASKTADKDRAYNAEEAEKNREYQTQERLATQEWNEQMWNKNNEYNSMSSQMQRALEAGVNPNALLGGSYSAAQSNAPTSSPMSGSQASYNSGMPSAYLQTFSQLGQMLANIKKTESETALNKQTYDWNEMTISDRKKALENANKESVARIAKTWKEVTKTDFDMQMQDKTYNWLAKKSETEIRVMTEQLNKLRNESLSILKDVDLKDKQGNLIDAQTEGQQEDNKLKALEVEFSNIIGMPSNTPETNALFKMWKSGDMQDVIDLTSSIQTVHPQNTLWGTFSQTASGVAARTRQFWKKVKDKFGELTDNKQHTHHINPK